jgi:hypothetical protein
MNTPARRLVVSAQFWRRTCALACATLLLLTSSSRAGTVLQFSQVAPTSSVTGSESSGTTTLSATSVPVILSNYNGVPQPPGIVVYETLTATSITTATSASGTVTQDYSGSVSFTASPGGAGANYLTATFSDAVFSGKGNSASLNSTFPNLTFTTNIPGVTFGPITGLSLAFSDVTPPVSITSGSVSSFTASNAGTASASIPEPGTLWLGSTAVVIGTLAAFGRKRMKHKEEK